MQATLRRRGKRKILRIREKRQGQRRRESVGSRRFRRLDIQSCCGREGDETDFSGHSVFAVRVFTCRKNFRNIFCAYFTVYSFITVQYPV
jgi:hypothetical protein